MTSGDLPPHHSRLPVAPSISPALRNEAIGEASAPLTVRALYVCLLAAVLGIAAAFTARILTGLIGLFTNLAYFHRVSTELVDPSGHTLGVWAIGIPVVGGLIVGVMARYGSTAIRGHGIPEAMEQVLLNRSRIPARVTLLKPLSAAIAIGSGGPFGAEGPIIATGGALGSLLGQFLRTTASERKVLLASGAAAGMAATFGTPVASVLLAVELLLFELRPRSIIPVAVAAAVATALRTSMLGSAPVFHMPVVDAVGGLGLLGFLVAGLALGVGSVGITRLVYFIEDAFEKLAIHWMWWPAIGAIAVGVVGQFAPETLGVGYSHIEAIISGDMALGAIGFLCVMKLISWSISLGSGTSGGTLAPLFIIGGGVGVLIAHGFNTLFPGIGMDLRIAGLVGMAATFAGASRAFLTSVFFAFEATQQPATLLPLLAGCAASYSCSLLLMKHSIMTEKIARRGIRVPTEYATDFLDQCLVGDFATREVETLSSSMTLADVRTWLSSDGEGARHQGYPVLAPDGELMGLLTRHDILDAASDASRPIGDLIQRGTVVAFPNNSLREAADSMVLSKVGRLVLVSPDEPTRMLGIITRTDILRAHDRRLFEDRETERHLDPREWVAGRAEGAN